MKFNLLRFFKNKTATKKIAIVGFGAGGVTSFYNLVNDFQKNSNNLEIDIFDGSPFFGKGVAYSTNNLSHLLNVPAGKMSALNSNPEHFFNWISENNYSYGENDFVPRAIYGKYLEYLLNQAQKIADQKKIKYNFIRKNIDKIENSGNGVIIEGKSYNFCILGLGLKLKDSVNNFWPRNFWYDNIEEYLSADEIQIIGAGLTSFDAIVALQDKNYQGKISVHSRSGLISVPHEDSEEIVVSPLKLEDADLPLSQIFHKFIAACKSSGQWREVMDSIRPLTQQFWQNLSLEKKQRFMRHCFRLWNVHRHRCPKIQFQRLNQMMEAGRLKFTTDPLDKSKKILNCSGFDLSSNFAFTQSLAQENLVKFDPLGFGVISLIPNLFIIGGLNFGRLFETTAMPEIKVQSAEVASEILRRLS